MAFIVSAQISTSEALVVRKDFAEKHPDVVARFANVTLDFFADYAARKDSWTVDSEPVQKIAKLTGSSAELLAGITFPNAQAQQTDALLKGGTAKAIGETVLPDYSAVVTNKFIRQ